MRETENKIECNYDLDPDADFYAPKKDTELASRMQSKIKKMRLDLGVTQRQLAGMVECRHTTISQMERGSLNANTKLGRKIIDKLESLDKGITKIPW